MAISLNDFNPHISRYFQVILLNMSDKVRYQCYFHFGLAGFYGIPTIVDYLMPKTLHTYILNIYDFVWLGFMAYQPL